MVKKCTENGCNSKHFGRGYCSIHYQRNLRRGLIPKKIELTETEKFWSRVEKTDSCWLWIGGKTGNSYGAFIGNKKQIGAHRYSYELFNGAIPGGLVLDHLCRNPSCVNPAHLEAVTQKINVLRSHISSPAKANSIKTHCMRGHEFSGRNLVVINGHRRCRECCNQAARNFTERKKQKLNKKLLRAKLKSPQQ